MSWEAWGDPEDSPYDQAAEAGWIDPDDLSKAMIDVMNERARQQDEEGFDPAHDDVYTHGELAGAASAYAMSAAACMQVGRNAPITKPPPFFMFTPTWWKPTTPRRDLIKAAALLLAEIERIDRAEAAAKGGAA